MEPISKTLDTGDIIIDQLGKHYLIKQARPAKNWRWEYLCERTEDQQTMWVNESTIDSHCHKP